MSIKVHLYLGLPRFTNTEDLVDIIEVNRNTVGECLDALVRDFPDARKGLFDENGQLLERIDIWVNENPAYHEGLDRQVKDGDAIYLFAEKLIVGGG